MATGFFFTGAFSVACLTVLVLGWYYRHVSFLTPEFGLGYYLGIAGGVVMLLLLLYPARKNFTFMQSWGRLKTWFITHMLMGITGPVIILFHCNFQLGSTNSNVALITMLIVVASGLIGRFLYRKVYIGLSRRRRELSDFKQKIDRVHDGMMQLPGFSPALQDALNHLESRYIQKKRKGIARHVAAFIFISIAARLAKIGLYKQAYSDIQAYSQLRRLAYGDVKKLQKQFKNAIRIYVRALLEEIRFRMYERLFALWHMVHLPFFVMLIVSSVFHVVAVHIY